MSGDQQLAACRHQAQEFDPDAGGLFGIMLESVVPVGLIETDRKHGVAGKGQRVIPGGNTDHAGGMTAGAARDNARRNLLLLVEGPQIAAVFVQELLRGCPKSVRETLRHLGVGKIRILPESDLRGGDVNPQVRTQAFLHAIDDKAANMIHVQVGQYEVGHRSEIDLGGCQPLDELPGARQVQVGVETEPGIDEDGLLTAAYHNDIQRPVERIRRQEHVFHPRRAGCRVRIVSQHLGRERQHPVTDDHHVDIADPQRIARWNQFSGPCFTGMKGILRRDLHLQRPRSPGFSNIKVVNLSLTGPDNLILHQAVRAASSKGTILIAAAGNGGPKSKPVYPAAYEDVIAVTAVDSARNPYRRAVRGHHIDLAAPGVSVWTAASISGARQKSGTSFAAPFVTAGASVLLASRPELTAKEIRAELLEAAEDMGAPGKDSIFGWGLLNVRELCRDYLGRGAGNTR